MQKTEDFRQGIIWGFFSMIWDLFAIFCQASRYRTRLQPSSGDSDSANWPEYEAASVQSYCQLSNHIGDRSTFDA